MHVDAENMNSIQPCIICPSLYGNDDCRHSCIKNRKLHELLNGLEKIRQQLENTAKNKLYHRQLYATPRTQSLRVTLTIQHIE